MVDKEKPKRPRRPAKKAPAKKAPANSNSKIAEAQQAASEKRIEQDTLRGQSSAERARQAGWSPDKPYAVIDGPAPPRYREPKPEKPAKQKPPELTANGLALRGEDPTAGPYGPKPPPVGYQHPSGPTQSSPGQEIAGLSLGLGLTPKPEPKRPLADPSLYAQPSAARQATLAAMKIAQDTAKTTALAAKKSAVYMGPGKVVARNQGPERIDPETGKSTTTFQAGDEIANSNDLMAWLSDPGKVAEIKAKANASGLNVQTYDDIAKLWQSVVTQAATTFSMTNQKVTPWAIMQLRGKYTDPNGNMQDKVSTSTSIDEMDPATARNMFEQTAQQMLGRAPTKAETDDFIAKAQMIARNNPQVTTTTQHVGFDGKVETTGAVSHSTGGASVVNNQSQMAAQDMAKGSEDYAAYQAAGVYFPALFDALKSPV